MDPDLLITIAFSSFVFLVATVGLTVIAVAAARSRRQGDVAATSAGKR